ncbi:hypothetical protein MTR72_16485 [Bradyrhizobium sp. ISRA442]|uniref:hypothetical protein n=1 Tax=Bradyrhizobium sp. ISRA442 TaxID=2866197 RepID=UPI00311B198D
MQVEELAKIATSNNQVVHIERSTRLSSSSSKVPGEEFGAEIMHAAERGRLDLHQSGTLVRLLRRWI